jgi:hypothetical protein
MQCRTYAMPAQRESETTQSATGAGVACRIGRGQQTLLHNNTAAPSRLQLSQGFKAPSSEDHRMSHAAFQTHLRILRVSHNVARAHCNVTL